MDSLRVEFQTVDGVTLRGDFFRAAGGGDTPAVVMAQGLSLLKEHYIEDTARRFQAAGISALVYDHRGYGSSGGYPRHQTDPLQQAEDFHDAVSALMALDGVNPSRVGIWGIGHAGGAAMISASGDPRIKAAVFNMPFLSGAYDLAAFPAGILERAWSYRAEQTASHHPQPAYVQLWPDSADNAAGRVGERTFLTGEAAWEFISGAVERSNAAGTQWENKITLQTFYCLARTQPADFLSRVTQPALHLAAAIDPLSGPIELHREVHDKEAGKNVEFVVLEPDHISTYFGESFEASIAAQIDFLDRKLVRG